MNVLIIDFGVVGKNLYKELSVLDPDCIDKYKHNAPAHPDSQKLYDIAFICVDTPFTSENPCDRTEVYNAIEENKKYLKPNGVFDIKSTVLPGTTDFINKNYGVNAIFSPEYYGGTQHCNNYTFDFTILGGEKEQCKKVVQALQKVYDGRHSFRIVDSRTAELVKYMENAWLATKVSFCSQFAEIAEQEGVNYEELRELFILDPRVNPSHTFIYDEHPYWESHCLDKDVPAIALEEDAWFLNAVCRYNEYRKKKISKEDM